MDSGNDFERWAEAKGICVEKWNERYFDSDAQVAWEAWKAATERAAGIVIEEGPVIGSIGVAMVAEKIMKGNDSPKGRDQHAEAGG